tara:strand:+ start:230 stop:1300 length:1071 start_codon:yes stop_codon:yes gene_type:complete
MNKLLPFNMPPISKSGMLGMLSGAGGAGACAFYELLGKTTLGSAGDDITVSSLANKPYLMVLYNVHQDGAAGPTIRLNGDTGSNYAWRNQRDGTSDTTGTSETYINLEHSGNTTNDFGYGFISNISGEEALTQTHSNWQGTAGAGNAPSRQETVGKWADTSTINSLTIHNPDAGSFDTGSEVVILGYDPDNASGTCAWEELANVTLGSAGDSIDTSTFTAKKYLMVQTNGIASGAINFNFTFNSDTGSNYAERYSENGGSDGTATNQSEIRPRIGGESTGHYGVYYISNITDKEKLLVGHTMTGGSSTGSGNAPTRSEEIAKWVNTSNQINRIEVENTAGGSFNTGSNITVYGFDP